MLGRAGGAQMNELSFDLGAEPVWLKCACGAQSSRVPCWECTVATRARAKADEDIALAMASFPARFAWARLGAPELADRVQAQEPIETLSKRILGAANAVFAGPSGSGKTSLAVACLRERRGLALYVSALRLATARIQHSAGDGEAPLVERAMRIPLLLIDEVGGEEKTSTSAVRSVVFARHDADLPTWITTGFNAPQLSAMYGDGFVRRVTDRATVVRLGGRRGA